MLMFVGTASQLTDAARQMGVLPWPAVSENVCTCGVCQDLWLSCGWRCCGIVVEPLVPAFTQQSIVEESHDVSYVEPDHPPSSGREAVFDQSSEGSSTEVAVDRYLAKDMTISGHARQIGTQTDGDLPGSLPGAVAHVSETSSEVSDGDEEDSEAEGSAASLVTSWTCDGCGVAPIVGKRFECLQCPGFDLCLACHARRAELHEMDHEFVVKVIPAGD
jgi:hypothetical protein